MNAGDNQNEADHASTNAMGITEVAEWCAAVARLSIVLFEWCGQQMGSTNDGTQQRWLATASHRHAWHAELARARMPTIPIVDAELLIAGVERQSFDPASIAPESADVGPADSADPTGVTSHAKPAEASTVSSGGAELDPHLLAAWQRGIAPLIDLLDRARRLSNATLDPSTARVVELVGNDLAALTG